MILSTRATASIALLASSVAGFSVNPVLQPRFAAKRSTTTDLFAIRCENKYYQLEEMEDKENSTTELFLNEDRTVSFGDTDGPMPSSVRGSWNVKPGANDFTMEIYRTFETGNGGTDVGEFEFSVDRIFTGEMTEVGESVAITGVMHDLENKDVGYFNMIDATAERAGLDKRVP